MRNATGSGTEAMDMLVCDGQFGQIDCGGNKHPWKGHQLPTYS